MPLLLSTRPLLKILDRARVSKTGNFVDWIQLRKLIERKEFGTFGVG